MATKDEAAKSMFAIAKEGVSSAIGWLSAPSMKVAQEASQIGVGVGKALKNNYYTPNPNKTKKAKNGKVYKLDENGKYIRKKDANGKEMKNRFVEADLSDYDFQYGKALGDGIKTGALVSGSYGAVKGIFTDDNEKFNLPGIPFI